MPYNKFKDNSDELTKLRHFFKEVANLTLNHAELAGSAVVYPKHLGAALEKVNPEWWKSLAILLLAFSFFLSGCSGGMTQTATTAPPSNPAPPTTSTPPPVVTAPTTPPPVTTPPPTDPPPVTTPPPTATPQLLTAWGNSQTQGSGLPDCGGNVMCESVYAWPQVMANLKGWTLDNQAVGGTVCAELSTSGRSESLWDLKIYQDSINIYAHFHNEEGSYGFESQGIYYARNCIEAQTAWLAIPETQKIRAINCAKFGTWAATLNSAAAITNDSGASMSCTVSGTVVYLSTARSTDGDVGTYSVSVDGNLVTNPESLSTSFSEFENISWPVMNNFIRVGNLPNTTHTVTYTCTHAGDTGCVVFYAAGLTGGTTTPIVYSMSPVPNATWDTDDYFDPKTYSQYYVEWKALVTELQGDGLNIIPIDVNNPNVYNPDIQGQGDGIHQNVAGHASIGNYAATR